MVQLATKRLGTYSHKNTMHAHSFAKACMVHHTWFMIQGFKSTRFKLLPFRKKKLVFKVRLYFFKKGRFLAAPDHFCTISPPPDIPEATCATFWSMFGINFVLHEVTSETEVMHRISEAFFGHSRWLFGEGGTVLVDVWLNFGQHSSVLAPFGLTSPSP